jgi:hypothetical protein
MSRLLMVENSARRRAGGMHLFYFLTFLRLFTYLLPIFCFVHGLVDIMGGRM